MAIYLLIFSLLAFIAFSIPIAYSMLGASFLALSTMPQDFIVISQRFIGSLHSFPLLAVPFFILAGNLMNHSGAAKRIFDFCLCIFGHITGGLAYVNVVASMIFSGMSGAATADAAGLGLIEIKAMKEEGYPDAFSAAVTAASSIIGPIIPPSVPLIIYGVMAQVSIGVLFIGGIIPGIITGLFLMVVIYFKAKSYDLPIRERSSFKGLYLSFLRAFPSLLAPVIILGGIFTGVFTPTEAGIVASVYALILGIIYKKLNLKNIIELTYDAFVFTAQICFIVAAASVFSWVISRLAIPSMLAALLMEITESPIIALFLINLVLLIMGLFIDALAIVIMATPVLIPIAGVYDIGPIHLGLMLILNTMIALNTPPVGLCLYIVSDIAKVPMSKLSKELLPFYVGLIATLLVIILFPSLVTYLPELFGY